MPFLSKKKRKELAQASENKRQLAIDAGANGPDPDADLASNAGFEVDVVESVSREKVGGICGTVELRSERKFTVQPVDKDATVDAPPIALEKAAQSDGSTVNDEEEGGAHHDEQPSVEKADDSDASRKRKKVLVFSVVAFILLLALLLGSLLGGKGKGNVNDNISILTGATEQDEELYIHVLLELDDRPEEVSWSVYYYAFNGTTVASVPPGTYTAEDAYINEKVPVQWNVDYYFRITDSGGDGLSSGKLGRWLLVYDGKELVSRKGDYGSEVIVAFTMSGQQGGPIIKQGARRAL